MRFSTFTSPPSNVCIPQLLTLTKNQRRFSPDLHLLLLLLHLRISTQQMTPQRHENSRDFTQHSPTPLIESPEADLQLRIQAHPMHPTTTHHPLTTTKPAHNIKLTSPPSPQQPPYAVASSNSTPTSPTNMRTNTRPKPRP